MPTPYPPEFRRDRGGSRWLAACDRSRAQVARSFGILESCLARWLAIADRDEGRPSTSSSTSSAGDDAEVRELRRDNKQPEQENKILRRATAYFGPQTLRRLRIPSRP